MNISLYDEVFDKVEVNNITALFTSYRVDKRTISEDACVYYIRGEEKDGEEFPFVGIEQKIGANDIFSGTIITLEPIDFGKGDSIKIENYRFTGDVSTFEAWNSFVKGTSFHKLTDAYRRRLEKFYADIDNACYSSGKRFKANSLPPSFIKIVIIPAIQSIAERMIGYNVIVPDPKTYSPSNNYYKVNIGVRTVGGISVPDGDDYSIYFTPLFRGKPVGDKVLVKNSGELRQLIINQLQKDNKKQ